MFKILFHCVNHDRRRWLRFPLLQDSEVVAEANLAYVEPIPERLTDDDVLLALDRLPADFRAIVLIVDVEEFSYNEASQILSIPVGTVMSRLSRGRKLLRDQLGEVARRYGIKKAEGYLLHPGMGWTRGFFQEANFRGPCPRPAPLAPAYTSVNGGGRENWPQEILR